MEKELQIQSNTLVYYDFQFKDKTIDINWVSLENVQFLKMRNIQNEISKMYIAAQNLIKNITLSYRDLSLLSVEHCPLRWYLPSRSLFRLALWLHRGPSLVSTPRPWRSGPPEGVGNDRHSPAGELWVFLRVKEA